MKELFTFDDVLIVPKFSLIESRADVSLKSNIRGLVLDALPVISANMDTVTGDNLSREMLKAGAQACIPRFGTISETILLFKAGSLYPAHTNITPMVSIGLGSNELERAEALFASGAHTFVVDVAHGAQIGVVKQVKALRKILGPDINVIVGNFASADTVKTFLDYCPEVDAFKIGIGPGSACTTRVKTGVGYPQLSAVLEVAQLLKGSDIKVIADGGMKKPGDVAKALGAGAHMVMLGGMLAGTNETPGEIAYFNSKGVETPKDHLFAKRILEDGSLQYIIHDPSDSSYTMLKKYRGSASQESYESQGKVGKHRTAEGESFLVPCKGSVADVLQDIEGGIRSAMTYVGAKNLKEFHSRVEFVRISNATQAENGAHGKK